jgi:hypothetical protein
MSGMPSYCPYCGIKVNHVDESLFCFSCGRKLPSECDYCPGCGKSLRRAPERAVNEPQTQSPIVAPVREDIARPASLGSSPQPKGTRINSEPLSEQIKIPSKSNKVFQFFRELFNGHWRTRGLYQKWVKEGVLPAEDIPTTEAIGKPRQENSQEHLEPGRLALIIVAGLIFIAFFIFIGITMSRC